MLLAQFAQTFADSACHWLDGIPIVVTSWSENAKREVPGIQYGAFGVAERLTIPPRQQPQQAIDQYLDRRMDWRVVVDLQFDKLETAFSPSLNEVNRAPLESMRPGNSRDQRDLVRPIYPTSLEQRTDEPALRFQPDSRVPLKRRLRLYLHSR